jgi:plasmid stabilization system protein ParE
MNSTISGGGTRNNTVLLTPTSAIDKLTKSFNKGKPVPSRSDLRYIIVRRRPKGYGHIAVYNYDDREVHLLHVFHTAQNWQAQLGDESY